MGHLSCCKCHGRIRSNTPKIRRTSEPQLLQFLAQLEINLPMGEPICGGCMQAIRRRAFAGESVSTQDHEEVTANANVEASFPGGESTREQTNNQQHPGNADIRTAEERPPKRPKQQQSTSNFVQAETQYSEASTDTTLNFESADLLLEENPNPRKGFSKVVPKIFLENVLTVPVTESDCFICGRSSLQRELQKKPVRNRIPAEAITDFWIKFRVLIPKGNRCCMGHMDGVIFTEEAKTAILLLAKKGATVSGEQFQQWINNLADLINAKNSLIDFDSPRLQDEDYKLFTGLYKSQFDQMLSCIEKYLYNTKHRSPRQALAIFLVHLRLGISQNFIASLFGVPIQRINDCIHVVSDLLTQHFVPKHLGIHHISREAAKAKHMNNFVSELFEIPVDKLMLIIDATYLYLNKPQNHQDQRDTYSLVKHRNLVKPTMIVFPDGYILDTVGLHKSNTNNNDATILFDVFQEPNGIKTFLMPKDHLVVDRGYRDFKGKYPKKDPCPYVVHMPYLLKKGQQQFTTKDANETRLITMIRWVVEAVNGRVKHVFRFFIAQVHNSYMIGNRLWDLWRIACATINAFFPPHYVQSMKHDKILEGVENRMKINNMLKSMVVNGGWVKKGAPQFRKATKENLEDFPHISESELFDITLGSYQAKNAVHYTRRQLDADPDYTVLIHDADEHLLRARIHSRFHSKDNHDVFIKYNPSKAGSSGIEQYNCTCKVGGRTVGTCSHVASVIWYLGFFRHSGLQIKKTGFGDILLDAAKRRVDVGQVAVDDIEEPQQPPTSSPVETLAEDGPETPTTLRPPAKRRSSNSSMDSLVRGRDGAAPHLRKLVIPSNVEANFLDCVSSNTSNDVETCGVLAGKIDGDELTITDLIVPKQTGTANTCCMLDEEGLFAMLTDLNLATLGWIHTHPSQRSFLSSVDLHTHFGFQTILPEAIAIVCAPTYDEVGVFTLTEKGMNEIRGCVLRGFHPHSSEMFVEATHVIRIPELDLRIHDLRLV